MDDIHEMLQQVNNNREAVVVCVLPVAKRPNKRSALVFLKIICIFILYIIASKDFNDDIVDNYVLLNVHKIIYMTYSTLLLYYPKCIVPYIAPPCPID